MDQRDGLIESRICFLSFFRTFQLLPFGHSRIVFFFSVFMAVDHVPSNSSHVAAENLATGTTVRQRVISQIHSLL